MEIAVVIAIVSAVIALVGLIAGPVRAWISDRANRPSLEVRLGEMGYIADVTGNRTERLRLEVSNEEGRAAADEVQLVVVDAEIPPRVAAFRPIRPSTSVQRVGLPLRWADSSPPSAIATIPPGATRVVELLFFEEPPEGQPPPATLDLVPETAQVQLELDPAVPLDELMQSIPGLRGLEQVPAKIRLALRSRVAREQQYTVVVNYNGFWPFDGMFLPERMGSHVKAKLRSGHLDYSESPFREPPEHPEDPDEGEWADVNLPPRAWSDGILKGRELGRRKAAERREREGKA